MNKTYFKRQLTLRKLGYQMNDDIQAYYDLFLKLIGDVNLLERKEFDYEDNIYYLHKGIVLLIFIPSENNFYINNDVWTMFEQKFNLENNKISKIFTILLEDAFNISLNTCFKYD